MRVHALILLALAAVLISPMPASAGDPPAAAAPAKDAGPKLATDAEAKTALDRFARQFDTKDLDFQLDAVLKLVKTHHPKVAAELLKLLKSREVEIQVEAMKGLGRQPCFAKKFERRITFWLDEKKFEPRLVSTTIKTIHALDFRKLEESVLKCIDSADDGVAIAAIRTLGDWRSYKSLKSLLLLWEFYPTDGTWSTGTVTVDTGASGNTDAKAAKAKWQAKYGSRPKRGRPEVVKALRAVANQIVGIKDEKKLLKRPKDLREWMSENKRMLRKFR